MDELDRYEQAGLDDSEDDRSLGQIFRDREAADRDMDRRQASQGRRGRGVPDILAGAKSAVWFLDLFCNLYIREAAFYAPGGLACL